MTAPRSPHRSPGKPAHPAGSDAASSRPARPAAAAKSVADRVYQRAGSTRYYLDVRDLGGGREALKPESSAYATSDPVVAMDLAARRVRDLMQAALTGQRLRHFAGVTRTAAVGAFASEWLRYKRQFCGDGGSPETGAGTVGTGGSAARAGAPRAADGARGGSAGGYTSLATLTRYGKALQQLFRVHDPDTPMHSVTVADVKRALAAMRDLPSRTGSGKGRAAARRRVVSAATGVAAAPGSAGIPADAVAPVPGPVPTLSAASLRQVIAAMQLLYDHAQDDGVVPKGHNPWRDLRRADRPKLPSESSTDFLEVHEAHALLEASGRVERRVLPLRTIVAALLLTGGRKDEVLGLEVSDVDFRRQTVRFRTNRWRGIKTAEERTVPLWPQLAHELRAYLARRPRIGGLLFPSPHATDPGPGAHTRSPEEHMITGLSRAFDDIAALAAADLATRYGPAVAAAFAAKRVNARSLRPTYCAARLQTTDRGEPVAVWTVRGEMGHSSLRMIDRVYGRLGQVRHRSPVVEFVAVDPGAADVHAANWKR